MIHLTHHLPDGTPLRAECEFCPEDPWQPSPFETAEELIASFHAYVRMHDRRGRVVPPAATLGVNSPTSRDRRGQYYYTAS